MIQIFIINFKSVTLYNNTMELGEGILTLTCAEGKLTRDTEFFGKMSPYCTITHNKNKHKTKVAHEQGKTPRWKDEF